MIKAKHNKFALGFLSSLVARELTRHFFHVGSACEG